MTGVGDDTVVVLKSPRYGPAGTSALPYRIDHLADHGFTLVWSDRRSELRGWRRRWVARSEALLAPWYQPWCLRRAIVEAPVVLAMFESEGHGLALARRLGWGRRAKLVVVSCWLGELARTAGPWRRRLYRALSRHVDVVTVFSANQVPVLAARLGIDPERITVVPFGIDTDETARLTPHDDGYLLAVGRDHARDWPTMLGAAARTDRPMVVLAPPSQFPTAEVGPNVEFLGYVERAHYLELLAGARAVAVVTRDVAYPSGQTVVAEALSLGKPVIVTRTPAMVDYAGSFPVTWVEVGDVEGLVRAIDDIARAPLPRVESSSLDARALWDAVAGVITTTRSSW